MKQAFEQAFYDAFQRTLKRVFWRAFEGALRRAMSDERKLVSEEWRLRATTDEPRVSSRLAIRLPSHAPTRRALSWR